MLPSLYLAVWVLRTVPLSVTWFIVSVPKLSVTPRLLKLPVSVRTSEPLAGTLTLLPETVLRAAVYENREILPLGSLGVGVGVSDNVAVV